LKTAILEQHVNRWAELFDKATEVLKRREDVSDAVLFSNQTGKEPQIVALVEAKQHARVDPHSIRGDIEHLLPKSVFEVSVHMVDDVSGGARGAKQ
jgi:hypothetical protein